MKIKHLLASLLLAFACGAPEDFDDIGETEQSFVTPLITAACGDTVPELGVNGASASWTLPRCDRNNPAHTCEFPAYKGGFQVALDGGPWTANDRAFLDAVGKSAASFFNVQLPSWSNTNPPMAFAFYGDGFHAPVWPDLAGSVVSVQKESFGLPAIPGSTLSVPISDLLHMRCSVGFAVPEITPYPAKFRLCQHYIAAFDYDRASAWITASGQCCSGAVLFESVLRYVFGQAVGFGSQVNLGVLGELPTQVMHSRFYRLTLADSFMCQSSGCEKSWTGNLHPTTDLPGQHQLQCLLE